MDDAITDRKRALYEEVADTYAEWLPDTSFEAGIDLALIRDLVEQFAAQAPDGRVEVLDAGCGTGRLIPYLRSLGDGVVPTGADLSPAMLAHARAAHPGVEFVAADLAALPFADGRFDGVVAWYSIIHTPPHALPRVFGELRRVLRPGGLLLLAYQAGVGERVRAGAYGHQVELLAFLHHTPYVQAALEAAGLAVELTLDRAPRDSRAQERQPQGFVLARRRD
ncbi:class I SAM-dependent methyltransferase [Leifsonia sp. F6_8S_P_1B]|uniref:Class I SAM-dependent methyltransferase n=1 Tax=Leifsonia williamsii TaxID=3035919 RepID=A0ABT8KBG8_9MICO|nr:class I SAM-dependent methyltransferase [Leifsonia williamsii]MDN4614502.1 class I SAM-dependent methyltransferase [Leifsonia williamsii]